jgi:hypothetical protein
VTQLFSVSRSISVVFFYKKEKEKKIKGDILKQMKITGMPTDPFLV